MEKEEEREQSGETVVELERETVRELRLMLRLYLWNTLLTGLGAVAGWLAFAVVVWVMLSR